MVKPFSRVLASSLVDFRAMQQQFAAADRLVIHDVAVRVLADVRIHQPRFIARNLAEGFLELDFAVAGSLHLSSSKGKPASRRSDR